MGLTISCPECKNVKNLHNWDLPNYDRLLAGAVSAGNVENVLTYLHQGANPNSIIEPALTTPMHFAAQRGNLEILEILLQHGGNINVRNLLGNAPLHDASQRVPATVQFLINQGADRNIRNNEGNTPRDIIQPLAHVPPFNQIDAILAA